MNTKKLCGSGRRSKSLRTISEYMKLFVLYSVQTCSIIVQKRIKKKLVYHIALGSECAFTHISLDVEQPSSQIIGGVVITDSPTRQRLLHSEAT